MLNFPHAQKGEFPNIGTARHILSVLSARSLLRIHFRRTLTSTSLTTLTTSHSFAARQEVAYSFSVPDNDDPVLPKGLSIKRQGESLEAARSNTGEIQLLFTQQGVELVRGIMKAGGNMTLVPSPNKDEVATEVYFILEGLLRCDLSNGTFRVSSNDYLAVEDLEEPVALTAETNVQFLYITFQPQFHYISSTLSELRKLAVEVEQKDGYTANHCKRLQALSYETGKVTGLPHYRLHCLEYGSYLHDVGKVDVPLEILNKPSSLTSLEWDIIKKHPIFGREMVEQTFMKDAGPIIEQHHERLDGSGYPYGLSGDEILTEAYIVAVADAYDAMTSNRPYRRAMSHDEAITELSRFAGQHYPSEILEAFLEVVSTMKP